MEFDLQSAYNLLHEGTLALSRAEQHGFRVDIEACQQKIKQLDKRVKKNNIQFKESDLAKDWGKEFKNKTNFGSDHQLRVLLYEVWKVKPPKATTSGKGSADEETLKQLGIKELDYLLNVRKYQKIRDTYLKAYLREAVEGFIHPSFLLHTVQTYRSSSSNPNFQNVPKRDKIAMQIVRSVLFPSIGRVLLEIDFSGIEVAVAACYHKDPEMLRYLHDPKSDMHADQAYIIFMMEAFDDLIKEKGFKGIPEFINLRQAGKNGFVFPEFYGDYYGSCAVSLACTWGKLPTGKWSPGQGIKLPGGIHLSNHLIGQGIKSLDKFTDHVKKVEDSFWNDRFPVYNRWRKRWFADYQDSGFFDMLTGFRCRGVMKRNEAVNYPVQGAAFHCLLWTLIQTDKIMRKEGWNTRIIGEVHDSMILDADPDELPHVVETINKIASQDLPEAWPWINVPMSIESEASPIDHPWSELQPYEM